MATVLGGVTTASAVAIYDDEAERAVLAGVLLNETLPTEVSSLLRPEMFYAEKHGLIYHAMLKLNNTAIDPVTLRNALGADLERAGGIEYMSSLIGVVPTTNHLRDHARLVHQKHVQRQLCKAALAFQDPDSDVARLGQAFDELDYLRRALREQQTAESFQPPTLAAFLAENADPVEWVVPGYAARGAITVVAGHAKVGKTTFLAEMVGAVTTGADFLGNPTAGGKVLWVDLEQPRGLTASVLGASRSSAAAVHVVWGALPDLDVLAEWCESNGVVFVIIDSWKKARGEMVEDANDEVQIDRAVQRFIEFTRRTGVALVLIAHSRKSGGSEGLDVRGSAALVEAVEIVVSFRRFSLEADIQDTRRVLEAYARYEETPHKLVIDRTESGYVAVGTPGEVKQREIWGRVAAALDSRPRTAEDVCDALRANGETISSSRVRTVLCEMVKHGRVARTGQGKRGNPMMYSPIAPVLDGSVVMTKSATTTTTPPLTLKPRRKETAESAEMEAEGDDLPLEDRSS